MNDLLKALMSAGATAVGGPAAGMLANTVLGAIDKEEEPPVNPRVQRNLNPFGMANGGMVGGQSMIPVEVEGDEMYELPNGEMGEFEGPDHEQGGIQTALPEGTMVYSKRLRGEDGRTMAQRKESRERRLRKILKELDKKSTDAPTINAVSREVNRLAQEEQEDTQIMQMQQMRQMLQQARMQNAQGMQQMAQQQMMQQQMAQEQGMPQEGMMQENMPQEGENMPMMQAGGMVSNTNPSPFYGSYADVMKKSPRTGVRQNPDGTESTHLMAREYVPNRGWVAFPTLFQNEDGAWMEMPMDKGWGPAYDEAVKRGEVYDFGEDKNAAIRFADRGSWKPTEFPSVPAEELIMPQDNTRVNTPMMQAGGMVGDPPTKNKDSLLENVFEFFDPTGISSHDDANAAYSSWMDRGQGNLGFLKNFPQTPPTLNETLDMVTAIPFIGKAGKFKYLKNVKNPEILKESSKYGSFILGKLIDNLDGIQDTWSDNISKYLKGETDEVSQEDYDKLINSGNDALIDGLNELQSVQRRVQKNYGFDTNKDFEQVNQVNLPMMQAGGMVIPNEPNSLEELEALGKTMQDNLSVVQSFENGGQVGNPGGVIMNPIFPEILPEVTVKAEAPQWLKDKRAKESRRELGSGQDLADVNKVKGVSPIEMIKQHHSGTDSRYVIVDKAGGMFHYFVGDKLIKSSEIVSGANAIDDPTMTVVKNGKVQWDKGNKSTGAGVRTVKRVDTDNKKYGDAPMYIFETPEGRNDRMSFHGILKSREKLLNDGDLSNNRATNGCVNCRAADLRELHKMGYREGDKLYILPDEPQNEFVQKFGDIVMETQDIGGLDESNVVMNNQIKQPPMANGGVVSYTPSIVAQINDLASMQKLKPEQIMGNGGGVGNLAGNISSGINDFFTEGAGNLAGNISSGINDFFGNLFGRKTGTTAASPPPTTQTTPPPAATTSSGTSSVTSSTTDSKDEGGEEDAFTTSPLTTAGYLTSGISPLVATIFNRLGDEPTPNFYANYGRDAERALDAAERGIAGARDRGFEENRLAQNLRARQARNAARSSNVQQAMQQAALTSGMKANEALTGQYQNALRALLANRAQFEQAQDQAVMRGREQAYTADLQNRDQFFTNLAQNLTNAGGMFQTLGRQKDIFNYLNEERRQRAEQSELSSALGPLLSLGQLFQQLSGQIEDAGKK